MVEEEIRMGSGGRDREARKRIRGWAYKVCPPYAVVSMNGYLLPTKYLVDKLPKSPAKHFREILNLGEKFLLAYRLMFSRQKYSHQIQQALIV